MKREKGKSRAIYYFRSTFFKLFTIHYSRFTVFFTVHVSLFTLFMFVPSVALCDMKQFIPTITDYAGDLETNMLYQSNDNKSGTVAKWSNTNELFTENLNLLLSGYIYHPRFIIFLGKVTGGLQQSEYRDNNSSTPFSTSFANEYELRVKILPEHPYNLELYTSRTEPFALQTVYSSVRPVTYEKGAIFNYRMAPLSFNAAYRNTTTQSSDTSDSTTEVVSAGYNIKHVNSAFSYTNSDVSTLSGRSRSQSTYNITNLISYEKMSFLDNIVLNSSFFRNTYDQKDPFDGGLDEQEQYILWTELLHMELPWNFKSDISYNLSQDSINSVFNDSDTATKTSNDTSRFIATLTHRLFRSLSTVFSYSWSATNSQGGETSGDTESVNATYTKTIPGGLLILSGSGSINTTDNTGSVSTVNQQYTAKATGADYFSVPQGMTDEASITVYVVDPQTGITYLLTNNVNYRIDPVGNTFRITILNLNNIPGFTVNPDPNFVYTFKVTYSSEQGTYVLRTTDTGYSVALDLFNHLVHPYYNYMHTSQDVVSGFFPGGPLHSTDNVIGVLLQKAPFRMQSEYEDYASTSNPYTAWRQRLGYNKTISPSLSFSAGLNYTLNNYPQSSLRNAYTEKEGSANIAMRKTFLSNLNFALSSTYSQTSGLVSATSLSFNSILTWHVGRLYIEGGATNQHTNSGSGISKVQTSSAYYYLKMRRQLF